MNLSEFHYHLPQDRIALRPARERDSSRLLVLHRESGKREHRIFRDIVEYFRPGDVLVLNDTRVFPARLYGSKHTGGKVEILLLKELGADTWQAVVKGLKEGEVVLQRGITAYVHRRNGTAEVKFEQKGRNKENQYTIRESLNSIGVTPLPPYIKRDSDESDSERYQTVYARRQGAVAAPTAGLHFTERLIKEIGVKGVEVKMLTLHVGYGTFKPVISPDITEHVVDEEWYEIPEDTVTAVNYAKYEGRRVIAVGTTVTRALEASAGLNHDDRVKAGPAYASIYIYPGYRFKITDAIVTNFHLPRSSPMILASAFSGIKLLKKAYDEASRNSYRFYSYGDVMLML
jgi:S-adenosylmethionine:tRNA ribosyltransferase-isomerase